MRSLFERVYALLLSLWVGAQAAVGYLVAPLLFQLLPDRSLAGTLAGRIFEVLGIVGLATLLLLLVLRTTLDRTAPDELSGIPATPPSWVRVSLALMLTLTALGHLWIRPWIASVRAEIQQAGGFELCAPALRSRFGQLHGLSSVIFLCVTLLGIALLLRLRERAVHD